MMKMAVVILLILIAGCCGPRQAEPPPIEDQLLHLLREVELVSSGDISARKLFAEALLRLKPEEKKRFHLSAIDLRKPTSSGCGLAQAAEADVAAGHFNILLAGDTFIPWETEKRMWAHISKTYGIRHFGFGFGGTEPAQFYELIEVYNKVVARRIRKTFGKSHHDIWLEAREAVGQNPSPQSARDEDDSSG